MNASSIYEKVNMFGKAKKCYTKLIEKYGDLSDDDEQVKQSAEHANDKIETFRAYGHFLARHGNTEEATNAIDRAIEFAVFQYAAGQGEQKVCELMQEQHDISENKEKYAEEKLAKVRG